ncbi:MULTISPECIES: PQQ-binding-like beta-propeller repeat protein [Crateriforma]|uniref:Outer membrane biogenesis protein BamB n=1 Tax=Crateriforma conspicua TaxID=2527996 RepID=A0A5C6FN93_9PLAN|nr:MULTISPECIES: PQQ-binding-like beta-propeller repeat protein [Crateriforma]TWU62118.1 outer membrane biogenesis protein BamB [Crateriforma conspicua]
MRQLTFAASLVCVVASAVNCIAQTPTFSESDWPWWRGESRQGNAAADQDPPTTWSEMDGVIWKTPLDGHGHGSPILLGDRMYLISADEQQRAQWLICLDRQTGQEHWKTAVHRGEFFRVGDRQPNEKSSWASSTPATDGERIFVNFYSDRAVHTSAVDLKGQILWQRKLCDYQIHQGYGSSPTVYRDLVIASADNKSGGCIVGLDRTTGQVVWRRDRPKKPNYASPIILTMDGKDQLIMIGCDLVTSLNPSTGKVFWETDGATTECVTSTPTDGKHIFTSGGYPKNHVAAVAADGSGEVVWETNTRAYVPSMLQRDGYLYLTLDAGVAMCIEAASGETMWKARLGGTFTASPVLVGDLIYATNESSETTVFRADPGAFDLVAKNQLNGTTFATPVICDGRVYIRVAKFEDDAKHDYLYCIGNGG